MLTITGPNGCWERSTGGGALCLLRMGSNQLRPSNLSSNMLWHAARDDCETAMQWLVFRNDGLTTAASYAAMAAEAGSRGSAVGRDELLDRFSPARPLARRYIWKVWQVACVLGCLQMCIGHLIQCSWYIILDKSTQQVPILVSGPVSML